MNVLVVGGGGREHTIVWALARSPRVTTILCSPGNAGTAALAENVPIPATDLDAIVECAFTREIELAIVGPEEPLAAGLVDALNAHGIPTFGPSRAAAELEASKWFAKQIMQEAGVPHAEGEAFTAADQDRAHAYIDGQAQNLPVIKADGLAAGKGVIVPETLSEAHSAIDTLLGGRFGKASSTVVVESRLRGLEASAMAFVDGTTVAPMPFACDYKRAQNGDQGPNTGGMGVYIPPGFLPADAGGRLFDQVHRPVVETMRWAGRPYLGILYAGLMIDEGAPSVLEFNCRFGDPETQIVLPQLETDLLDVLEACIERRLASQPLAWRGGASVGVVLASGGYPGSYEIGKPITGLDAVDPDVMVFHAGTALTDAGGVVTNGGRVLTVVAQAPRLAEARARVYDNVARIHFDGCAYRTDIALREL